MGLRIKGMYFSALRQDKLAEILEETCLSKIRASTKTTGNFLTCPRPGLAPGRHWWTTWSTLLISLIRTTSVATVRGGLPWWPIVWVRGMEKVTSDSRLAGNGFNWVLRFPAPLTTGFFTNVGRKVTVIEIQKLKLFWWWLKLKYNSLYVLSFVVCYIVSRTNFLLFHVWFCNLITVNKHTYIYVVKIA